MVERLNLCTHVGKHGKENRNDNVEKGRCNSFFSILWSTGDVVSISLLICLYTQKVFKKQNNKIKFQHYKSIFEFAQYLFFQTKY